jgi:hypothetical protein
VLIRLISVRLIDAQSKEWGTISWVLFIGLGKTLTYLVENMWNMTQKFGIPRKIGS